MLTCVWTWMSGGNEATEKSRHTQSPSFEWLESRVHLSADGVVVAPSEPAGAALGDSVVVVNLSQEQVLFHDGFDGTHLDMTRWMLPVWQSPTDGTYLGRTQLRVAQNAGPPEVSEGALHLQLDTYNPTALVPGDSFYGQEIISRTVFSRGEGLAFETRARVVPPAPGGIVYAAFLYATIPGENTHDEIDFELLTNEIQSGANRVQTNVYDRQPLGAGTPQFAIVPGGDLTQYHTYRAEWLADQVRWYVDGTLVRTETAKVPDGPMALYFNTWVPGAEWPDAYNPALQPAANAAANQTFFFDVDYVTVSSFTTGSALRPIYRFWSAAYSRHFYTIREAERDKLINQYPHTWTYEGPVYRAFADGTQADTAPVYRFWSGTLNTHFYTMSTGERDKLTTSFAHVWTYEGVAFHAYAVGSQPQEARAVYRFWSGTLSRHFYTASQGEWDKLVNSFPHVWTYEFVAWYAYGL